MDRNCEHIRPLLSRYLDGELDVEEQRRVSDHLTRCEGCRHEFESLRRLVTRMAALKDVAPERDFAQSVLEEIQPVRRGFWGHVLSPGLGLSAAALALLLVGVFAAAPLFLEENETMQVARVSDESPRLQKQREAKSLHELSLPHPEAGLREEIAETTGVRSANRRPNEGEPLAVPPTEGEAAILDDIEESMESLIAGANTYRAEVEGRTGDLGAARSVREGNRRLPSWDEAVAEAQADLEGGPSDDTTDAFLAKASDTESVGEDLWQDYLLENGRNREAGTREGMAPAPGEDRDGMVGVEAREFLEEALEQEDADTRDGTFFSELEDTAQEQVLGEIRAASPGAPLTYDLILASTEPIESATHLVERFRNQGLATPRIVSSTAHPYITLETRLAPEARAGALQVAILSRLAPHSMGYFSQNKLPVAGEAMPSSKKADRVAPVSDLRAAREDRSRARREPSMAGTEVPGGVVPPESDAIMDSREGDELSKPDAFRSLGYVSASSTPETAPAPQLPQRQQTVPFRILIVPKTVAGYGQDPAPHLDQALREQLQSLGYISD